MITHKKFTTLVHLIALKKIKKIAIIGCPGSGKTTLAKKLSTLLALPVHHLDDICWKSGWQPVDITTISTLHHDLCMTPQWIIDGNNIATMKERLHKADLIIFFIVPRWLCMIRIIQRWLKSCIHSTQNNSSATLLQKAYLRYAWNFKKQYQPHLTQIINQSCKPCIILYNTEKIS